MIFRSLFKPKWEHHNPEVRKRAIASLDTGQQESRSILAQVARHDGEPEVRRVAIKRLADLDLLEEIARTDSDGACASWPASVFANCSPGTASIAPNWAGARRCSPRSARRASSSTSPSTVASRSFASQPWRGWSESRCWGISPSRTRMRACVSRPWTASPSAPP